MEKATWQRELPGQGRGAVKAAAFVQSSRLLGHCNLAACGPDAGPRSPILSHPIPILLGAGPASPPPHGPGWEPCKGPELSERC